MKKIIVASGLLFILLAFASHKKKNATARDIKKSSVLVEPMSKQNSFQAAAFKMKLRPTGIFIGSNAGN